MEPISLGLLALGFIALKQKNSSTDTTAVDTAQPPQNASNTTQWTKYDPLFRLSAAANNIDWTWLKGIALNETSLGTNSRYTTRQVSYDGLSYGLMQFTLSTARSVSGNEYLQDQDLWDDSLSIDLAAKYIAQLYEQFDGDERSVIMSYNQGAGNTRAGHEYAAGYYDRWVRWMTIIRAGQTPPQFAQVS